MPPGTVQINDTFFVDKTEIANVHWREYLYYLLDVKKDTIAYQKALPDTTVWGVDTISDRYDSTYQLQITTFSPNPLSEYYFRHPGFNNNPVVGITYEQAIAFCQWRSDRVNELYATMPENKRPFKKVTYRLLTEQEWELIAAGNLPVEKHPYGYDSVYKKWKKEYYNAFNCKFSADTPFYKLWGEMKIYTSSAYSYFPNSSHTYNIIGNVAEMVAEKGIAKGGSFVHTLEECKITNDQYYTKPERWLGFRCVAVVVR